MNDSFANQARILVFGMFGIAFMFGFIVGFVWPK